MKELDKNKIVEEINKQDLKSISKIPTPSYIFGMVFLLPVILLLVVMFVAVTDTPTSIGIILFKVIFFLVAITVIAFKRMRNLVANAFTNPAAVTIGFLTSAFFIVRDNFSMFTPEEGPGFKSALPFAIIVWLLFPVIQSKWFVDKVPKWFLWILRIPVWAIVFFTTMVLLEIGAMSLFGQLG